MRLSSGRGTSWHHLSCFNSGPTLRAQTQRKTLHSQGRSGACAAAPAHTGSYSWAAAQCTYGDTRHCINCSQTWLLSTTPHRQGKGNHLETPKLLAGAARAGLKEHTHGRQESEFLPASEKIQIRTFSLPNDSTAASRTPTDLLGVYLHAVLAYCLWA